MPGAEHDLFLLREALGDKFWCLRCHIEFCVYRSDIHHSWEELPVTHCPFCGGKVELA